MNILIIWFSHLIMDFMLGIWPVYKTLAKLNLSSAGFIAGISMLLGEGMQIVFGYYGDRGWQKYFAAFGIFLTGMVSLLAYAPGYFTLFLIVLSIYLGSSAFHPTALAMVSQWVDKKKGLAIALFFSGGTIGAALSQGVFTQLYHSYQGETWIFMIPAALLSALLLYLPFPAQNREASQLSIKEIWKDLLPEKITLTQLFLIQACNQGIILSLMFFLPDILTGGWLGSGGAQACFILGAAVAALPSGYLADRFGEYPLLIITNIIGALSYTLLLSGYTHPALLIAIILFILGGTLGVAAPVIIAKGNRTVNSSAQSLISGVLLGGATCMSSIILIASSTLVTLFETDGPLQCLRLTGLLYLAIISSLFYLALRQRRESLYGYSDHYST